MPLEHWAVGGRECSISRGVVRILLNSLFEESRGLLDVPSVAALPEELSPQIKLIRFSVRGVALTEASCFGTAESDGKRPCDPLRDCVLNGEDIAKRFIVHI